MSTDTQQDAREQARHQIAVMQAWVDGKEVQISEKDLDVWEDHADPSFNWGDYDYRVKPEEQKPRDLWVNKFCNGEVRLYDSEIESLKDCARTSECGIHYREVLPEAETE